MNIGYLRTLGMTMQPSLTRDRSLDLRLAAVAIASSILGCDGAPSAALTFEKLVIDPAYRAEGVTVFDVDKDGVLDIVTAELWYRGPDFVPFEIRTPRAFDPLTGYCHSFGAFHEDIDGDGFEDLISLAAPGAEGAWCANPAGADRHWSCSTIAPSISGESPLLADVLSDGDRRLFVGIEPELQLGWLEPGPVLAEPWQLKAITSRDFPHAARYEHGLGFGDLNRDLRHDIITGSGWLEQPASVSPGAPWEWHPVPWCPNNCSHMFVYDINADGLPDVLGTSPHGYGVWWWEQQPGNLTEPLVFKQHAIDNTISQTHAARFVDLDGDRVPELVTGKRWFAHFESDPGALEPAMLVIYKMHRDATGVRWSRIDVDDDSGVGTQFEVIDVTNDSLPDIVVSNKKGLHVFVQR